MQIDDLEFKSIADMSTEEAISFLREIRLKRRMPTVKKTTSVKKKKVYKASDVEKDISKMSLGDISALLNKL